MPIYLINHNKSMNILKEMDLTFLIVYLDYYMYSCHFKKLTIHFI
jgi:hypothetical protein